jgi:hypothetical protein
MKNDVTPLFDPSGEPLFAVEVGKGAYELTNTKPSVGKVSPKTKQKNRARNKAARKSKQRSR